MTAGPLVAQTLRTWREAERLLEALPPDSPDHETMRLLLQDLRAHYNDLTSEQGATESRIRASQAAIDRATAALARIAAKGLPAPDGDGRSDPDLGPAAEAV